MHSYDRHAKGMRNACEVHVKCIRDAIKMYGNEMKMHEKCIRNSCETHARSIRNAIKNTLVINAKCMWNASKCIDNTQERHAEYIGKNM